MPNSNENRWLLLIHQIPPKPAYLRVKIGRRLQGIGAVAIKNTVYVLPGTDRTLEDFQWTAREIAESGGEATVCEAKFIEGRTDPEIEAIFNETRAPDYDDILEQARAVLGELPEEPLDPEIRRRGEQELARLERRFADTRMIDFFGAPGSEAAGPGPGNVLCAAGLHGHSGPELLVCGVSRRRLGGRPLFWIKGRRLGCRRGGGDTRRPTGAEARGNGCARRTRIRRLFFAKTNPVWQRPALPRL